MVRAAGADWRDGERDRGALMPRKRRPGPKKRRGPKKGSRSKWTLEGFVQFEDELESALQLEETYVLRVGAGTDKPLKWRTPSVQKRPLQKPTGQFCFRLPVLNTSEKAQKLHDAEFTKKLGNLERLQRKLAELRKVKRRSPARFNVAKWKYLLGDGKN
jgi:hypothetical protein